MVVAINYLIFLIIESSQSPGAIAELGMQGNLRGIGGAARQS